MLEKKRPLAKFIHRREPPYFPEPVTLANNSYGSLRATGVAVLANGDVAVSWIGYTPKEQDGIYAQIFSPALEKRFPEPVLVNTYSLQRSTTSRYYQTLAALPNGNIAISWAGAGKEDDKGVYYQVLRSDLTPILQNQALANSDISGEQTSPAIRSISSGDFVISWTNYYNNYAGDATVSARLFSPTGIKKSAYPFFETYGRDSNIGARSDGKFEICYITPSVVSQIFSDSGSKWGKSSVINGNPSSRWPAVTHFNDTRTFGWSLPGNERYSTYDYQIYGQSLPQGLITSPSEESSGSHSSAIGDIVGAVFGTLFFCCICAYFCLRPSSGSGESGGSGRGDSYTPNNTGDNTYDKIETRNQYRSAVDAYRDSPSEINKDRVNTASSNMEGVGLHMEIG